MDGEPLPSSAEGGGQDVRGSLDVEALVQNCPLVVDMRNATRDVENARECDNKAYTKER
jgi:hypothetical protein